MLMADPCWCKMAETAGKQRERGKSLPLCRLLPRPLAGSISSEPLWLGRCAAGMAPGSAPEAESRRVVLMLRQRTSSLAHRLGEPWKQIQGLPPRCKASQNPMQRSTKGTLPRNGFPELGMWCWWDLR